jgi:AsmA family protein
MRLKRLFGVIAAVTAAMLVAAVVILQSMDFGGYKQALADRVSAATGRKVTVSGPMRLNLLTLRPTLSAEGVSLANPPGASRPDMVRVERLFAEIELWGLLRGRLRVHRLIMVDPDILLETDVAGHGNWMFETVEKPDAPKRGKNRFYHIADLHIERAHVGYLDGASGKVISTLIDAITLHADDREAPVKIRIKGALQEQEFLLEGDIGPLADLAKPFAPYPISFRLEVGEAELALGGTLARPLELRGVSLALTAGGTSLEGVGKLLGRSLPEISPIQFAAKITDDPNGWSFGNLDLKLGETRVSGDIDLLLDGPRPRISADIDAANLDLGELVPVEGQAEPPVAAARFFGADSLPFRQLAAFDADARVKVARAVFGRTVLTNVKSELALKDGRLSTKDLQFEIENGGLVSAGVKIEAASEPASVALEMRARGFTLGKFLRASRVTDVLDGSVNLDAELSGRGASPQQIAASLEGNASAAMGKALLRNKNAELIAADLLPRLLPLGNRRTTTKINCFVSRFDIASGIATSRLLLLDTEAVTVTGGGTIDLGTETLDLLFKPEAKDPSLVSLAVPVRLGGSLLGPTVRPDEAALALRIGGAALALVNPLLLIPALGSLGTGEAAPCLTAMSGDAGRASPQRAPSAIESISQGVTGGIRSIEEGLRSRFGR